MYEYKHTENADLWNTVYSFISRIFADDETFVGNTLNDKKMCVFSCKLWNK